MEGKGKERGGKGGERKQEKQKGGEKEKRSKKRQKCSHSWNLTHALLGLDQIGPNDYGYKTIN